PCYGVFFKGLKLDKATAILITYVDDIMCVSSDPQAHLDEIAKVVECSEVTDVDDVPQKHIGVEIYMNDGVFHTSLDGYLKEISSKTIQEDIEQLTKTKVERYNKPYVLPIRVENEESYKLTDINLFQQYTGLLCWLGTCHPAL